MSERNVAPSEQMMRLLLGYAVSQAVYVVARTGVATVLEQEGPATLAELAERTGTRPEALARLVRTLTPLGVFTTDGDVVGVTETGALLSEEHPQSLYGFARTMMEQHYLPFSELGHSVRTGRPGAQHYLGAPWLDWVNADPQRAEVFGQGMASATRGLKAGMFDGYRLPPGKTVADLGGSDGSMLVELFARDDEPDRRGIVFDRPTTVRTAVPVLAAAGLTDRIDVVSGDFFVAVPTADVYLLSYILHDWDDDENRRILGSIAAAAPPGARLLIVENVVSAGDEPQMAKDIDLLMLGMTTGMERTERHYRDLLDGAGFTLDRVVGTPTPFSILEATLR